MSVQGGDRGGSGEADGGSTESHPFPRRLRGGYHEGARLLGIEGGTAVYYNRVGRSLVRYRYDHDEDLLTAEQGSEERLPPETSVGTYLRGRADRFAVLSAWGRVLIGDCGRA